MKKSIKKLVSMVMVLSMVFAISTTVFASESAEVTSNESGIELYSTLHKVNGVYSKNGAGVTYTTTLSRTCKEIRVKGVTYDYATPKMISVHIYHKEGLEELLVASITNVKLDDEEHVMTIYDPFVDDLHAGTYTVKTTTSDLKPYDVSTYFYY